MLQFVTQPFRSFAKLFRPPSHTHPFVTAGSIEDCLRALEREARLPKNDLRIEGDPREVTTFPALRDGLEYRVVSKTSERWRDSPDVEGYIAGTVFETTGPSSLNQEQLGRMKPGIAAAVAIPHVCVGRLHISRNCPGVFKDDRCTSCGHRSH